MRLGSIAVIWTRAAFRACATCTQRRLYVVLGTCMLTCELQIHRAVLPAGKGSCYAHRGVFHPVLGAPTDAGVLGSLPCSGSPTCCCPGPLMGRLSLCPPLRSASCRQRFCLRRRRCHRLMHDDTTDLPLRACICSTSTVRAWCSFSSASGGRTRASVLGWSATFRWVTLWRALHPMPHTQTMLPRCVPRLLHWLIRHGDSRLLIAAR